MFGFGKKKVSAHLYAANLISISFAMRNTFVTIWNSYRHIANADALDETDGELIKFFHLYSNLSCSARGHHKLTNAQDIELYLNQILMKVV